MKKVIFLILIAILSSPGRLLAADPIIVTWTLVSPDPNIKVTHTFREVEGDMIEFSSTSIFNDGSSHSVKSMWPKEGGVVKDLSGTFPEDSLLVEVLDESGQWYHLVMENGRQVAVYHKIVSEDGKTLTMTGKNAGSDGKESDIKIVYKRDGEVNLTGEETNNILKNKTSHANRYIKNNDGTLTDKLSNKKIERYIDNGDGTITDRYVGLMMFQEPLRLERSWGDTKDEIMKFNMEKKFGYDGWRLPTILEWKNILDETRTKPPTLPAGNPFRNVNTHHYYWSKTASTRKGRWGVADLARGKVKTVSRTEKYFVWPVRAVNDID